MNRYTKDERSPTVMSPLRIRNAPSPMIDTFTNDGVASMSASNVDRRFIARVRAVCKRREITANRSVSRSSAPNAFTTSTPSKLSWAASDSSPNSSCAER